MNTLATGTPTRKCPVCGKPFELRCRPDEWGWFFDGRRDKDTGELVLLCSGTCSKRYADEQDRKTIRRMLKSPAYKAYRLWIGGMTEREIAERIGRPPGSVQSSIEMMANTHFREIELIDRNGEAAYTT